jgi:hypothetical protein
MTVKELTITSLYPWKTKFKKLELEVKQGGVWVEVVNMTDSMFWVKGQDGAILEDALPSLKFRAKVG